MIYGKKRADIADPHGLVHITVADDPVTIKQGGDLLRLTRAGAREMATDLLACLDELEGQ